MRIAVDLTPMLPGGENGGAKTMILALLQNLIALRPDWHFVLLTAAVSHDELAFLDGERVERLCVVGQKPASDGETQKASFAYRVLRRLYWGVRKYAPETVTLRLKRWYYRWRWVPRSMGRLHSVLENVQADLLFSPFTAPFFYDPRVPMVSIIYDLQFMEYPHFFSQEERAHRYRYINDAIHLSTHVVTISEFVRHTVLQEFSLPPNRVTAIPIGVPRALPSLPKDEAEAWLSEMMLKPGSYFLYPANFWPHKNHEALLIAFQILKNKMPDEQIYLVLTGALENRKQTLLAAAKRMGLSQWVRFPGFLPEENLGTLYAHARALIFPSLYEGFGIPVLEAMSMDVPVACSQVASLPEVGGDAVLYFDPRNPHKIADAMYRLWVDDELRQNLVAQGKQRLQRFGDGRELALRYAKIFEHIEQRGTQYTQYILDRVDEDGWLGVQTLFVFPAENKKRRLKLTCDLPNWAPFPINIQITTSTGKVLLEQRFKPGQQLTLSLNLPSGSGVFKILGQPSFCPQEWGFGDDMRSLSVRCLDARVIAQDDAGSVLWSLT